MSYEAQVTFKKREPLIFARPSESISLVLNSPMKCWVSVERDKLIFMSSENYPLCHLYLSTCHLSLNNDTSSLTIFIIANKPQKDTSAHTNKNSQIDAQASNLQFSQKSSQPQRSSSKKTNLQNLNQTNKQSLQENNNERIDTKLQNEDQKEQVTIIKASEACLRRIESEVPRRPHKSCLSFVPSAVQHVSILSGQSPTQKFRGFLNLIAVMFFILNLRNIIDNFLNYGALFTASPFGVIPLEAFIGVALLFVFAEIARLLEYCRFKKTLSTHSVTLLASANITLLLLFVIFCCRCFLDQSPLSGLIFAAFGVVFSLKLVSYLQVNAELWEMDVRMQELSKKQFTQFAFGRHQISQDNLNLLQQQSGKGIEMWVLRGRLYYFLAAPTLCYQLNYPHSQGIRWGWLSKRVLQFLVILGFELVVWRQYILPQLNQWVMMKDNTPTIEVIYRILRLAVPNTIGWILGFYNFFHLFLNIMAELTQFGDRNFYRDWWNCRNLEEYWKTWNLPVHFWFIRHCYNPLLSKGWSRVSASLVVFIISALFHQFLLAVPLGVVSYYAFLAMLMQAPTIFLQRNIVRILRLKNSELGNVSFWLFFCVLGQPIILFIYYSLYVNKITSA